MKTFDDVHDDCYEAHKKELEAVIEQTYKHGYEDGYEAGKQEGTMAKGYMRGLAMGNLWGLEKAGLEAKKRVLPRPCDGELYEDWELSDYIGKIGEEYSETVKAAMDHQDTFSAEWTALPDNQMKLKGKAKHHLAAELTDIITISISTLHFLGYDEAARAKLYQQVNESNARRDEGRRFRK